MFDINWAKADPVLSKLALAASVLVMAVEAYELNWVAVGGWFICTLRFLSDVINLKREHVNV